MGVVASRRLGVAPYDGAVLLCRLPKNDPPMRRYSREIGTTGERTW